MLLLPILRVGEVSMPDNSGSVRPVGRRCAHQLLAHPRFEHQLLTRFISWDHPNIYCFNFKSAATTTPARREQLATARISNDNINGARVATARRPRQSSESSRCDTAAQP